VIDPYLKLIAKKDIPSKKDGLNICVFADYNVAGNLTLITELINKYTIHKARCIIVVGDYLDYGKDIVLIDSKIERAIDKASASEAAEIVNKADFFHIGRHAVNFEDIHFENIFNQNNCVFQYFGSHLRDNVDTIREFHERSGIHGVSWVDWTMQENAGPMHYHLPDIFDVEKVKPWFQDSPNMDMDPILIAHSPTNRAFKKTNFFLEVIEKLKKEFNIELILLEGLSNEECMERKNVAHILFDQISVGRFALSAIESMAMNQAVLCSVSNIVQSVFPEHPVISVTKKTLEQELRALITNKDKILDVGMKGRKWVKRHCDPVRAIKQWVYLYDLIINGNRIIENDDFFINI
jgi:hypothetical protein